MPDPATAGTSSTSDYEQLGYDAAGNVVSRRLRDGQTIQFSYDALDRMTYRNIPSPVTGESDVAYYYDNLGRVTSIQDALGHYVNRTYDPLGRVTLETTETGQRGLTTDEAGQLILLGWDPGSCPGQARPEHRLRPAGHRRSLADAGKSGLRQLHPGDVRLRRSGTPDEPHPGQWRKHDPRL